MKKVQILGKTNFSCFLKRRVTKITQDDIKKIQKIPTKDQWKKRRTEKEQKVINESLNNLNLQKALENYELVNKMSRGSATIQHLLEEIEDPMLKSENEMTG